MSKNYSYWIGSRAEKKKKKTLKKQHKISIVFTGNVNNILRPDFHQKQDIYTIYIFETSKNTLFLRLKKKKIRSRSLHELIHYTITYGKNRDTMNTII